MSKQVEPKDIKRLDKIAKENAERAKAIGRQWLAFSKTEAYQDFMEYGHSTSEMLTTYAKEMVMPSPVKDGEQIVIDGEKSLSLLQNSRGCDIILSYAEEQVASGTRK
jgi:hypothetical protein